MNSISWDEFKKIEIRIGTIIEAKIFPEAIKPAYQIKVDLGNKIGIKKTSAQITDLYNTQDLIGKQVLVVVNLLPKKIGPFTSECLITGFYNSKKEVVLATSHQRVENGSLLV
tara:strand:- start:219 stop:557 length:339 start_codon:yes stop_codon:yes gene_type:complete